MGKKNRSKMAAVKRLKEAALKKRNKQQQQRAIYRRQLNDDGRRNVEEEEVSNNINSNGHDNDHDSAAADDRQRQCMDDDEAKIRQALKTMVKQKKDLSKDWLKNLLKQLSISVPGKQENNGNGVGGNNIDQQYLKKMLLEKFDEMYLNDDGDDYDDDEEYDDDESCCTISNDSSHSTGDDQDDDVDEEDEDDFEHLEISDDNDDVDGDADDDEKVKQNEMKKKKNKNKKEKSVNNLKKSKRGDDLHDEEETESSMPKPTLTTFQPFKMLNHYITAASFYHNRDRLPKSHTRRRHHASSAASLLHQRYPYGLGRGDGNISIATVYLFILSLFIFLMIFFTHREVFDFGHWKQVALTEVYCIALALWALYGTSYDLTPALCRYGYWLEPFTIIGSILWTIVQHQQAAASSASGGDDTKVMQSQQQQHNDDDIQFGEWRFNFQYLVAWCFPFYSLRFAALQQMLFPGRRERFNPESPILAALFIFYTFGMLFLAIGLINQYRLLFGIQLFTHPGTAENGMLSQHGHYDMDDMYDMPPLPKWFQRRYI